MAQHAARDSRIRHPGLLWLRRRTATVPNPSQAIPNLCQVLLRCHSPHGQQAVCGAAAKLKPQRAAAVLPPWLGAHQWDGTHSACAPVPRGQRTADRAAARSLGRGNPSYRPCVRSCWSWPSCADAQSKPALRLSGSSRAVWTPQPQFINTKVTPERQDYGCWRQRSRRVQHVRSPYLWRGTLAMRKKFNAEKMIAARERTIGRKRSRHHNGRGRRAHWQQDDLHG